MAAPSSPSNIWFSSRMRFFWVWCQRSAARQRFAFKPREGAVKHVWREADLGQGATHRQMRLPHQPDDLKLLSCRIPHSGYPPTVSRQVMRCVPDMAVHVFLRTRFSRMMSATSSFCANASAYRLPGNGTREGCPSRPARQAPLSSRVASSSSTPSGVKMSRKPCASHSR